MEYYRQNELPETVKRYKTYTDSFQEWLMKTAIQRGVENAAQIAEQAKTKKKSKKTYKISTAQQNILVDGIAGKKGPLVDTSGLRDLEDAIRSRKEVTQFHKLAQSGDTGHSFFNSVLQNAHSKLTNLIAIIPVRLKAQGLEDNASTFAFYLFNKDEEDKSDNATTENVAEDDGHEKRQASSHENPGAARKRKRTENPLSKQEIELQRDFLVLCFLYELNRVRDVVREVWMLYHQGVLSLITAALVTDLVQGYIQQNVAALIEELKSYDSELQLPLPELVLQLCDKLSASNTPPIVKSVSPQESDKAFRDLLCINAITLFEVYLSQTPLAKDGMAPPSSSKLSSVQFLQHFDAVRKGKVKLPIWDKFTEAMTRRTKTPDAYLPFGFQIVLDIHEITRDDYDKVFKDVTQHGFDIAHLIRTHTDYEDYMWKIGQRPEYMSAGDLKFSNVYLSSMNSLLNWIQELLKVKDDSGQEMGMATGIFLTVQPTLAGLSMWNFNRTYHGFSIAKVKWFVTTLAHLYNATLKVGGLTLLWPDLDYIISLHGADRLFVGGVPQVPQDFLERWYMSTCISSRSMTKDFKQTGAFLPQVSNEVKSKRGLAPHFRLEDAIYKYYGPDEKNERWLKRHAIFNCLHQLAKQASVGSRSVESALDPKKLVELRNSFDAMATKVAPRKSKNRRKNPSRVATPKFAQKDNTHATLFRTMQSELMSHELHSHFDYLSFYRRAYDFILRVRGEVLFDNALQIARRGDIQEDQDPHNETLLAELFEGLKIKPKSKKVKTTGKEVSTDVVPLDKLKHIARILKDVIREGGSVESDRAQMRCERNWEGLGPSYDSEKEKKYGLKVQGQRLPVRNGQQTGDKAVPTIHEECAECEHLPPGHWPVGFDTSPKDLHRLKAPAQSGISSVPVSELPESLGEEGKNVGRLKAKNIGAVYDVLDEFDSDLGSESDSDKHTDISELKPLSPAEALLRRVKDADAEVLLAANKLTNQPHQAYVSEEADEDNFWSTAPCEEPPSVSQKVNIDDTETQDDIEPAIEVLPRGDTLELQELQGHDTTNNIHSKGPEAGGIVEVRSCNRDHATNAIGGMNAANIAQGEEDQGHQVHVAQEDLPLVQTPKSTLDTTGSRIREASSSASTDDLTSTSTSVSHYDKLYDELPTYIPYLTRTRESDSHSVRKPHRLTCSRVKSRDHTVTVTPALGRLIFSRHSKGHRHCLIALARTQDLSLRSNVMCSLGRALSSQKSRLQRRMHISTKVLLAKKAWTRLDLQVAASMIRVSEPSSTVGSVGKDGWDSESSTD
jgi:hypothetical protein